MSSIDVGAAPDQGFPALTGRQRRNTLDRDSRDAVERNGEGIPSLCLLLNLHQPGRARSDRYHTGRQSLWLEKFAPRFAYPLATQQRSGGVQSASLRVGGEGEGGDEAVCSHLAGARPAKWHDKAAKWKKEGGGEWHGSVHKIFASHSPLLAV